MFLHLYQSITKFNFILPSISSCSEFLSINCTSIYENCELSVSKKPNFHGEILSTYPNDLFEKCACKTLDSVDKCY